MNTKKQLSIKNCLKIAAIGIGIIILIGFALAFGWIAGIVWLVFFRKRLNSDPEKQKRLTIIISALSIASFIFMLYSAITKPSLTSITISPDTASQELEIGKDYIINVEFKPNDAETPSFEYNIDGSCATFTHSNADSTKAILHTTSEGTALISISSGKIRSNTLEFTIVGKKEEEASNVSDPAPTNPEDNPDKAGDANEKEQESQTEEKPKPEPEEKPEEEPEKRPDTIDGDIKVSFSDSVPEDAKGLFRLARVDTNKEIQDYALEYYKSYFQSDEEIHGIINSALSTTNRLSIIPPSTLEIMVFDYVENEELSAKTLFGGTLIKQYWIDIKTGEISDISQESEPTEEDISGNLGSAAPEESTDTADPEPEAIQETPAPAEPAADMVWIDDTGKKYHSKSSCSNMSDPYQIPRADAEAMGRGACKKCY